LGVQSAPMRSKPNQPKPSISGRARPEPRSTKQLSQCSARGSSRADAQAKSAQEASAAQPEGAAGAGAPKDEGNVVDAEYTEVKDKKSA